MLTREQLRSEVGSNRYFGGLVFGKRVGMHVGRCGQGLAEAGARRGVRIYENAPVLGLARHTGTEHQVKTLSGEVRAKQVLLATGTSAV